MPAKTRNGSDTHSRAHGGESDKVLAKIEKLVALANDDGDGNEEEARTAAIQAVRLMVEHDLALVPRKNLEEARAFVEGAKKLATNAQKEKWQYIGLGALGAMMLGKGKLF